jgi:hypothetical protein
MSSNDDICRDSRGRFRKGNPGGPGRPFGSLSGVKAPLAFFRDVVRNWEQHGEATLTGLILTDPVRYAHLMSAPSRQATSASTGGGMVTGRTAVLRRPASPTGPNISDREGLRLRQSPSCSRRRSNARSPCTFVRIRRGPQTGSFLSELTKAQAACAALLRYVIASGIQAAALVHVVKFIANDVSDVPRLARLNRQIVIQRFDFKFPPA